MPPRQETRSEADAFIARLNNRTPEERTRLLREHRAFLSGDRDQDTNFHDAVVQTVMAGPSRTPAPVRLPPTGETASYIEAVRKQKAAEATAEGSEKKKKTEKKRELAKGKKR
ncbi:hypothetical protein PHMEG_00026244 [Phytophthora megakarya]|uniref:Uncharacterized protein n=1 Tax=Phytophthora megakarya TaxID=4795 RepID=A0A225V9P7_9STRA|nr:hypothetical protein PHMEG_00026244 [Phytophthora megakarya]